MNLDGMDLSGASVTTWCTFCNSRPSVGDLNVEDESGPIDLPICGPCLIAENEKQEIKGFEEVREFLTDGDGFEWKDGVWQPPLFAEGESQ